MIEKSTSMHMNSELNILNYIRKIQEQMISHAESKKHFKGLLRRAEENKVEENENILRILSYWNGKKE